MFEKWQSFQVSRSLREMHRVKLQRDVSKMSLPQSGNVSGPREPNGIMFFSNTETRYSPKLIWETEGTVWILCQEDVWVPRFQNKAIDYFYTCANAGILKRR